MKRNIYIANKYLYCYYPSKVPSIMVFFFRPTRSVTRRKKAHKINSYDNYIINSYRSQRVRYRHYKRAYYESVIAITSFRRGCEKVFERALFRNYCRRYLDKKRERKKLPAIYFCTPAMFSIRIRTLFARRV